MAARPVAIEPRVDAVHELSPLQTRIWTSGRLAPTAPLPNMAKTHRWSEAIDPDLLIAAFDSVVRASDVLRTVVDDRSGGRPMARVLHSPPARTTVIDLDASELERWCADRISRPIDISTSAYDSVLIRHGTEDWTWWIDLHHLATDAWSSMRVFELVGDEYRRLRDAPDDEAELDLGSFYEHAASAPVDDAEATTENASTSSTLYGPPGTSTTRVTQRTVELSEQLDDLPARYRSISPNLATVAVAGSAMATTLHRLSGDTTVTLGVPVHHRSDPRSAQLLGPLMEIHPVVVTVDPDATFGDVFDHVHRQLLTMLKVSRKRRPAQNVQVDAIVNVVTATYGDFAGMACETRWYRPTHVEAEHPIRLHAWNYGDGANLELDINAGLSGDGSHQAFPDHFAAVLDAALRDPDAVVGDVDMLTSSERSMLAALNPSAAAERFDTPVHLLIADRLREHPDHVVADDGDDTLTAGRLDECATALARWLRTNGVERGDRVGLRMQRSLDVLVAIHGVLRAGAAFVMLDPDDPVERHEAIIADAGLRLVLDKLPGGLDATDAVGIDVSIDVTLDDDAYVIYTSGSTGTPKGVPISHRGLADYLGNAVAAYATRSDFVMPMHSALVFDLSITSLFLPQLMGGRTVVVGGDPVSALSAIAADRRLTVVKATPSQLEILTRLADRPLPLEVVIVGGEAFRRPVATALATTAPGVRIFNEYGPAEAVVGCMLHEWDPAVDRGVDVPIGRATPGAQVHVLDQRRRPRPVGAWGELYVARTGMADGYLGLPDATAEKFTVIDGVGDGVLYRTGDRVRVEGDVLVYGGRVDDQLSVSGVRLEPGEIEAALMRHPGITGAVVRVWSPGVEVIVHCVRCGLGDDVPGIEIDGEGLCTTCRDFDRIEPQTRSWFRDGDDLDEALQDARRRASGDIDCLHLLSGGKDSTYALYQLVERGWRVHALTLDNGFISDGAKENVRRSIADLGITHEFVTTDAMNEIFRDSLDRFANVCNGCYKTIYTLATARAHEMGIPVIVTGLSRGQFFETRLLPHQFEADRFDPDEIDRTVLQARRAYHQTRDAVTELLPEHAVFERTDIDVLDEITYLDFFRYVDVELAEMYEFLENRAPWVRPDDTGRSTNCLVNVAGIHTHQTERGFHNYAEPYAWDVRLGHKTRDEALAELDDDIDVAEVQPMLDEIGYEPDRPEVLTAWYQTEHGDPIDARLLATHLRDIISARAVPTAFVHVADLPIAESTKLDVAALPAPTYLDVGSATYVAPTTPTEAVTAEIWETVLGIARVGLDDDFFDLGGASLLALEVVAATERRLDVELPDALVFEQRRLADFARAVDAHLGVTTALGVLPETTSGPAPLSAGEEAMLFEYRSDPTDVRYNVTRHYVVDADVDVDRLEQALRVVVERHEPLHTSYAADRSTLSADRAMSFATIPDGVDADEVVAEQSSLPFDLDRGPLLRAHVGRRDAGTDIVLALHHITIDAGTFDVLWNDLDAAYHGHELPPLATTYAAHGAWQRTVLADRAVPVAELDDFVGVELPPRSRDASDTEDGYLYRDATVSTSELAAAASTTPFAAALAAASVALGAYSRDGVVEIGVTASTKDHPATDPLVGYYLNSLPVVLDLRGAHTLAAVDDLASRQVAELMTHRTVPFADLVRDARDRGRREPNISHMLAYEQLAPAHFGDTVARHRIAAAPTAVSDLTFFVQERGDHLAVALEFRGSAVSKDHASALLGAFDDALTSICRRPGRSVGDARSAILGEDLRGTPLDAAETTLADRVAATARATPHAVAATDADGRTVSYADLRDRAASLATVLRSGADALGRVGVALPRSTRVVEAMVGTWLAGASYVPIDPTIPTARRRAIVAAAGLDAVITDESTVDLFEGIRTIDIDGVEPTSAATDVFPDASSPAYVIFTSGSTGTPAGVEVSHANLAASTAARTGVYGSDAPRRFLVTPSIGFDSSMVGLAWPLATGGTVVMPDDEVVHDVDRLGDAIDQLDVTHLLMVPSLYAALLQRRPHRLTRLDTVIVAGEAVHSDLVHAHFAALPDVALVNEYGPTEATVWAAAHVCAPGDDPVPIGRPIPGTRLRVADASHQPMGRGAAGELLIAGPGVVDRYVSGRSGDAFVETGRDDGEDGGVRWYRTGDLVRVDEHDRLLFLGRVDDQLNVGGLRLEPVELEAAIRELDGVTEAVAVEAEVGGRASIVAHLAGDPSLLDLATVRTHVAQRLGAGAAPARIAFHDRLPRTANGKLDRSAAADLPHASAPAITTTKRSETDTGSVIAIWRRAFGTEDIDSDGDFFSLGGDSLTAVAVVSALADLVGRDVAIAELLSAPTPGTMAERLGIAADTGAERRDAEESIITVLTLREGAPGGPTVLMTPAWDSVMGYRELADGFPDHVRVLAASMIGGGESGDAAALTVEDLSVATLDPVVEALGPSPRPIVVIGWSIGGVAAYDLGQRLGERGVDVASVALVDTLFPGQHLHIWSNRWWKYKSMLRPGSFGEAAREFAIMGRRRVDKLIVRLGRKLLEWGGQPTTGDVVDTTASGVPVGALDSRPVRTSVPVTLYAADTTSRDRTERPWRTVAPDLRVVSIQGRHRGFQSVMAADRVGQIVDDVVASLLGADPESDLRRGSPRPGDQ